MMHTYISRTTPPQSPPFQGLFLASLRTLLPTKHTRSVRPDCLLMHTHTHTLCARVLKQTVKVQMTERSLLVSSLFFGDLTTSFHSSHSRRTLGAEFFFCHNTTHRWHWVPFLYPTKIFFLKIFFGRLEDSNPSPYALLNSAHTLTTHSPPPTRLDLSSKQRKKMFLKNRKIFDIPRIWTHFHSAIVTARIRTWPCALFFSTERVRLAQNLIPKLVLVLLCVCAIYLLNFLLRARKFENL